jgi:hypothetical protein
MAKKKFENVKTPVNTGIVDDFLNENIGTTVKEVKPKTQKKEKKQKPKIEVPQDVNIENEIKTEAINDLPLVFTPDKLVYVSLDEPTTEPIENIEENVPVVEDLIDNNDEDIVLGEISLEDIIDEQNSTETDSDKLTEEKVENPPIEENKSVSSPKIRIVNTFSGIHYDI